MKQKFENIIVKKQYFNFFVYISLFFLLVLGTGIYKDYGISVDEPFQRASGYYWYLSILENFTNNSKELDFLRNNFEKMEWSKALLEGAFIQYGPFFDTLLVFLESKLNISNTKDIYEFKHFANFIVFYISSIFFLLIIKNRFKNNFLTLIGFFFYITSPRIFGSSFYNCKDIIFMSLTIICIYFAIKLLIKIKVKNILFFSIFAGLATSVRIMGIFYFLLLFVFLIIENYENNLSFKKKFSYFFFILSSYIIFTYIFWPYLWDDPIKNFFEAFKYFQKFGWDGSVFYLGNYIKANSLPWHYPIVWIFITTPLFYLILFLIGIYFVIKDFFRNFLNNEKNSLKSNFWSSKNEKIDIFILGGFMGPIILIILLNSSLYNGWRQIYFVYPFLTYMSVVGLFSCLNLFNKFKIFLLSFIVCTIFFNIFTIYKLHPFQTIYFNIFAEKNANKFFVIDYWGLGNKVALEKIVKDSDGKNVSVGTASFTPLEYSRYMLNGGVAKKILFSGNSELNQDYIFTNFLYDSNPKYQRKFSIPKEYEKIFELKKGNIIINQVYKK